MGHGPSEQLNKTLPTPFATSHQMACQTRLKIHSILQVHESRRKYQRSCRREI